MLWTTAKVCQKSGSKRILFKNFKVNNQLSSFPLYAARSLYTVFVLLLVSDRLLQSFIARNILQLLDVESLANAEQVSLCWKDVIVSGKLWEKLLRRKVLDFLVAIF